MPVTFPRCYLSINGAMIPCISATVTRHSKRSADTFTADLAMDVSARFGMSAAAWADFQPQDVTVYMSSTPGGGDLRAMVTSTVDEPTIHWLENKVEVRGRDKSAVFTNTKRNKKYVNQKSSDIVSDIASDAGLSPQVQDSGDPSGQKYDQDVVHLTLNRSDYETLDALADREGFRWYVDGNSLYFEPDTQSNGNFSVYYAPPDPNDPASGNILELTTGRNMQAAKPHKMTVKSWHHKDKQVYEDTEQAGGVGDTVTVEHHHNGRNQAQVQNLAKSRLKNAIRHEMSVHIRMPGDLTCDVRQTLTLSGTGTIFDQDYDIDTVEFEMSWEGGFTMEMEAKRPKAGRQ